MTETTYNHIVAAVDFSAQTPMVIEKACVLKEQFNAKLELIHVVEIPVYPVLEDMAVMGGPGLWDEEVAENILESSNKKLAAMASQYGIQYYSVLNGLANTDICQFAQRSQADLIILGSHGVGGWKRLLGSTTNSVVNHAECDVLLVKAKGSK